MDPSQPLWLGTPDRYARLRRIETLDPVADHREITHLFMADFGSSLMLQAVSGFLMTYAAPRMSRILDATGQLGGNVAKRFVDTALLFRYPLEHGLGPGIGREAARRVNGMHRRYDIHPDDFIMVGVDVPLMALEYAGKFGWRPVSDIERDALVVYYGHLARAFGSHRPLPPTLEGMREFWERYMDTELAFEPQNHRLARVMLDFVATMLPRAVRPQATELLLAQVDPRIVSACGFDVPPAEAEAQSTALFRAIGQHDPAPDGAPDGLLAMAGAVYPGGVHLDSLGTGPEAAPTALGTSG
jgi:hypothetical protein